MPDTRRCCILEVCCVPGSQEQIDALAEFMAEALGPVADEKSELRAHLGEAAAAVLKQFKLVSR